MANPGSQDDEQAGPGPAGKWPTGKWIEIHNPTADPIDLQGVVLAAGGEDGEAATQVLGLLTGSIIGSGEYLVLGSGSAGDGAGNGGVGLDDLPDGDGRVALRCDVIEVDAVTYPAMAPGVARGLSGTAEPDHEVNDDPERWCAAAGTFAPGLAGSPGAPNEACPGEPGGGPGGGPGGCLDGDTLREPVVPGPGDLVITEIMANPDAVSDSDGEWIEIYAAADVDLNGLAVGREPGSPRTVLADDACLRAAAGSHLVLAASIDPAENGGLPRADHEADLGLLNSGGSLFLGSGDAVLDQVAWTSSRAGASLRLDPGALSAGDNDDPERWCEDADSTYGSGDTGTPGAANPPCAQPPPNDGGDGDDPPGGGTPGDHCDDGGTPRPIVRPEPGQVTITEYMPNPSAVSDAAGEWFELRVDADIDLNGLELGKEPGEVLVTIAAESCLHAAAGTRVVLARSAEAAENGGLPRVDAIFGFSLVNSGGSVFVGVAGEVLDHVAYPSSSAGVATSRDPSAVDGNGGATWCPSPAEPYGDGDHGTPGAPNPPCPTAASEAVGDAVVDPG